MVRGNLGQNPWDTEEQIASVRHRFNKMYLIFVITSVESSSFDLFVIKFLLELLLF